MFHFDQCPRAKSLGGFLAIWVCVSWSISLTVGLVIEALAGSFGRCFGSGSKNVVMYFFWKVAVLSGFCVPVLLVSEDRGVVMLLIGSWFFFGASS